MMNDLFVRSKKHFQRRRLRPKNGLKTNLEMVKVRLKVMRGLWSFTVRGSFGSTTVGILFIQAV